MALRPQQLSSYCGMVNVSRRKRVCVHSQMAVSWRYHGFFFSFALFSLYFLSLPSSLFSSFLSTRSLYVVQYCLKLKIFQSLACRDCRLHLADEALNVGSFSLWPFAWTASLNRNLSSSNFEPVLAPEVLLLASRPSAAGVVTLGHFAPRIPTL